VPGLASPYRIAQLLPAVYQEEDPFIARFTGGLDDVLAPVIATLDCLDSYLDPRLAPEDFLEWIASWVGATLNDNVPLPLRRAAVAHAATLHRQRGTMAGLRTSLELLTGGQVELADSGAATWSTTPGGSPAGDAAPWLRVRVTLPAELQGSVEAMRSAIEAAVAAAKPAHVMHSVEVVSR
jgi:phage tail-like protein